MKKARTLKMKKMKIRGKIVGALALITTFAVGMSPITTYAQANAEPECICEEKCIEDKVNPKCKVCVEDYSLCKGVEKVVEEEVFGPLTPDGNLTLVDDYGSVQAGGKQFITVVTKTGNYFYIIIDRDDEGDETVHFLNMVDESDLLKLMDDEEAQAYINSISGVSGNEVVVEETPEEPESVEEEPVEEEKKSSNNGVLVLLLAAIGAGAGGYFYLKQSKGKDKANSDWDPDYDYNEDEDYLANLVGDEEFEDKQNAEEFDFDEE